MDSISLTKLFAIQNLPAIHAAASTAHLVLQVNILAFNMIPHVSSKWRTPNIFPDVSLFNQKFIGA
jgi:hypothetical protein